MHLAIPLLFCGLGLEVLSLESPQLPDCRCTPPDPCWPNEEQWNALNQTLDGNLIRPQPVGIVCHHPNYDQGRCAEVNANSPSSIWRTAQPAASVWTNWEAWPLHNESCYVDTPRGIPCEQGRISLYSALVKSVSHIRAADKFAAEHNFRFAVKNTGHDLTGRSLAPRSLQIFTHNMKGIVYVPVLVPDGFPGDVRVTTFRDAVTVQAGVQLGELYNFCARKNVSVVGGLSRTVGAAGGYVQGGGHLLLGPWKGMASDNVLQYEVITASGELVIANAYQNDDLFWALRGGGGGTFGIVTSVTIRVHPNVPVIRASLVLTRPLADAPFWLLIQRLYEHLPALVEGFHFSSSHTIFPVFPEYAPIATNPSTIMLGLNFVDQRDVDSVKAALEPLEKAFQDVTNENTVSMPPGFIFNVTSFPGIGQWFDSVLPEDDVGGISTIMGSRLVSQAFITSPKGPSAIANAFSKIRILPSEAVIGTVVAGGAVSQNGHMISSALSPAWRRALAQMVVARVWPSNATIAQQEQIQQELTQVQVPLLKALKFPDEPEMGTYLNDADPNEPDFQRSFWGENYRRLYEIKKKWDPKGLFVVRKGVGSEDWDDDGLCRI